MQYLRKHYGYVVIGALSVLPVFLWLSVDGLSGVFADTGSLVASAGKAMALAGIALFSCMPVLSMRHNFISRLFGGIDSTYRIHARGGKVSFFLILAHPLLLGLGRMLSGKSFTRIWDWSSLLVLSGIAALLVFVFVVFVSVYAHIKHQNWVWIHRLFGWLIPVFFLHALVARSKVVQNKFLLVYLLGLGAVGLCAFMYRSVFSKYLIKRYKYVVSEVNQLSDKVVELVLSPQGVPLNFMPGQFAYLAFEGAGVDAEPHPFSFSNSNNGPYVRFTIKTLGDDTAKIREVTPGTTALLEGPYGNFSYKNTKNRRQAWIAGGIGITPFLSMARSFSGTKEYDIHFFYGTETIEEAVFLQEFIDITRHLPDNFHTSVVSKDISGFVSTDLLQRSLGDVKEFDFFICGPPGMMKALQSQLLGAGVPEQQIHVESFSL